MPGKFDAKDLGEEFIEAIDRMRCGLVAMDPGGVITFANSRLADMLATEKEKMIGRQDLEYVPAELREIFREENESTGEPNQRTSLTALLRANGTTFPALLFPKHYLDAAGQPTGSMIVVIDLGSVQTARHIGYSGGSNVRNALEQIALDLQSASLLVGGIAAPGLPMSHPELAELSPREKEVLALLVDGDRVPVIARQLHISPHTVRNHLKSVFDKLGVRNQSDLIRCVRELAENTG